MKEALASYKVTEKQTKTGRAYISPRIYLPTKLVSDSSFPFKDPSLRVHVKIKGKQLIIQKATSRHLKKFGELTEEPEAGG
ncbi:MAG: hypothetical protein QXJ75_00885 [Candidatus Bathyarchaeia archaeon]